MTGFIKKFLDFSMKRYHKQIYFKNCCGVELHCRIQRFNPMRYFKLRMRGQHNKNRQKMQKNQSQNRKTKS